VLYKVLAIVLCLMMIGVFIEEVLRPAAAPPTNNAVNERTYKSLREGMSEAEIQAMLGLPHSTSGGVIARVDNQDSAGFKYAIQPRKTGSTVDRMNLYQGPDEESIRVLFSGETGRVIAMEYRVAELPVLYKGHRGMAAAAQFAGSVERAADTDMADRRQVMRRRQRIEQLQGREVAENAEQLADRTAAPTASQRRGDAPPQPLPKADRSSDSSGEASDGDVKPRRSAAGATASTGATP